MCYVACGLCNGESTRYGIDPKTRSSPPMRIGFIPGTTEQGYWFGLITFIVVIALFIRAYVDGSAVYISITLYIMISIIGLTILMRIGQKYLVVDPKRDELVMVESGFCFLIYREHFRFPFSKILGFITELSSVGEDVIYQLWITVKPDNDTIDQQMDTATSNDDNNNNKDNTYQAILIYYGKMGTVHNKCIKLQEWAMNNKYMNNNKDIANIQLDFQHIYGPFYDIEWLLSDMKRINGKDDNYQIVNNAYKKDKKTLEEAHKAAKEDENLNEDGIVEAVVNKAKEIMNETVEIGTNADGKL